MKNERLLTALGNIDDELIENAWVYCANKRMYEIAKVLNKSYSELLDTKDKFI